MNSYCDILWLEDIHGTSADIKKYYGKYSFRVKLKMKVLDILRYLENEENFSHYSCVVLDINLEKGFEYNGMDAAEEFKMIEEILKKNDVKILNEHNPYASDDEDEDDEEERGHIPFRKNAGYYIYRYLLNKKMPSERICMLTGNKGAENLTGKWEKIFSKTATTVPHAFDRETELKNFLTWLEERLTTPFRLRACVLGMSFYAKKLLKDEKSKEYLQKLSAIPLVFHKNNELFAPEFAAALKKFVEPWESREDDFAYKMTLKTARNWFLHFCIDENKIRWLTVAFLFGIALRGVLGKDIRPKIDDKKNFNVSNDDKENLEGFRLWEDELIKLIGKLDKEKISTNKDLEELVMDSCIEFFKRVVKVEGRNLKMDFKATVCNLIQNVIGRKENEIEIKEEDLLRHFLHAIYRTYWNGKIKFKNNKPTLEWTLNLSGNSAESEKKYLSAIKNTLAQAILN